MLKRRYANDVCGDFKIKYEDCDFFKGYVCCTKLICKEPVVVNNGIKNICVQDIDYLWIQAFPDNSNYAITIIFDKALRIVEWYFDIAKSVGIENGIPYEDDLFLDMVITDEEQVLVLDEDELKNAKLNGVIDKNDVNLAYKALKMLKTKFANDIKGLKNLTKHFCSLFNYKYEYKEN